MELKPLQDLETFYDIDINRGVLVNSVDHNSPAEKAGVKSQDILLDINGKPINVRFPEEIAAARKMIADLPIGSDAILTIKRDKETMTLNAKTEKLQGAVGEEKEFKTWGLVGARVDANVCQRSPIGRHARRRRDHRKPRICRGQGRARPRRRDSQRQSSTR